MNNNKTCIHGGVSPVSLLVELHHSQAGSGRHRCPTCAYEQGFYLGSSGRWSSYEEYCNILSDPETCQEGAIAPSHILSRLGENQGGKGRHKCTNCAFQQGFEVGVLENGINEITIELVPTPEPISERDINFKKKIIASNNTDFIEKEIRNKHLGLLGELFILQSEIEYLNANGREDLAVQVEHVSSVIGDGLGYDILSYDLSGNEKKIEVKTTRSDITRPFYLTRNELEVSINNPENYYLYRLFDFDSNLNKGKYYLLRGNLADALELDALVFKAFPKSRNNR